MNKAAGFLTVLATLLIFVALLVMTMDALTHGGLFKGPVWQCLRSLWIHE